MKMQMSNLFEQLMLAQDICLTWIFFFQPLFPEMRKFWLVWTHMHIKKKKHQHRRTIALSLFSLNTGSEWLQKSFEQWEHGRKTIALVRSYYLQSRYDKTSASSTQLRRILRTCFCLLYLEEERVFRDDWQVFPTTLEGMWQAYRHENQFSYVSGIAKFTLGSIDSHENLCVNFESVVWSSGSKSKQCLLHSI